MRLTRDTTPPEDQDSEDLAAARKTPATGGEEGKPWYKCIGPGLITGAADDDPSGVGTYSANGARFGYGLLWLVPLCIPLMIAVQEMCGRIASITGQGLASVIKQHYPKWLLHTCVSLLVFANVFNIFADLNVMAASAKMLVGIPMWAGIFGFTAILVATQILIPYRRYSSVLKWLCFALAGYALVVIMPGVKIDWLAVGRGMIMPNVAIDPDTILAIVAFLGTTISPYLFFWQAGETVEEEVADGKSDEPGTRLADVTDSEIRNVRADTVTGMVVSQFVALFIVVAASGTLHASGKLNIDTAQDAALALKPLGPAAYLIFSICMIGTGLLAIPTLAGSAAYGIAETFGWRYGLYRRYGRAKGFYLIIAAVIVLGALLNFVGAISPIKALVYSAALNGMIAPALIVVLLLICNNRKIVGERTNSRASNFFSWLTVALMGPAAIYLVYAMTAGKT